MKKSSVVVLLFFAGFLFYAYSERNAEISKAQSYLNKKGEVYFRFSKTTRAEANTLTDMISLDNVTGTDVYAYANKNEFANFLKLNKDFEVLRHPGDPLEPPKMSDYKNPEDRQSWNTYPTWQGYVDMMKKFETDYPQIAKLIEVGQTVKGKTLYYLKISTNVAVDDGKPEFSYSSTMHGDETCGYVLMLRLIDYLLKGYPSDPEVKKLVEGIQIYIMPLENPDGCYNSGDNSVSGAVRGNANGVDLNRSYPGPIGQEGTVQKETTAMMNFYKAHDGFTLLMNFHGGAELFNYDWDCWTSSSKSHPDWPWYVHMGRQFADSVHKVSSTVFTGQNNGITEGGDWYIVKGSRQQWCNWYVHSQEVTTELSNTKLVSAGDLPIRWNYYNRSFLKYMAHCLEGIQGTIKNAAGNPVKAKVWVESHDVLKDSVFMYSKMPNGDYHRLIDKGTYSVTYTIPGETPITKTGIVVEYDKATIVNIGPTDIMMARAKNNSLEKQVTVMPVKNGVRFLGTRNITFMYIYTLNGTLVKTFSNNGKNILVWNGDDSFGNTVGSGNYIASMVSDNKFGTKKVVLAR